MIGALSSLIFFVTFAPFRCGKRRQQSTNVSYKQFNLKQFLLFSGHWPNNTTVSQLRFNFDNAKQSLMELCKTFVNKYDINYSHCYTMFASTNLACTQVTLNRWSTADQDWQEYDQIKKLSGAGNKTLRKSIFMLKAFYKKFKLI